MALSEGATEAVRDSDLPAALVEESATAKPYREGRSARIEVTSDVEAELVRALVRVKMASS